jgi:Family of unknown function (DUF6065)
MKIRPASRERSWMNTDAGRFAKRCLPLLISNQAGWELLNPVGFSAIWDGTDGIDAVRIWPHITGEQPAALSHFGSGTITWNLPYLFRTPPGWNLLARGPANSPKDGISALEGMIETDWTATPFTMNWKLTRPGQLVAFEPDEPFALLVPTRRGELESFAPSICGPDAVPDTYMQFQRWSHSRARFNRELAVPGSSARYESWQRHYMLGVDIDGLAAPAHQRKLRLKPFT